jgi:hypothetical protein
MMPFPRSKLRDLETGGRIGAKDMFMHSRSLLRAAGESLHLIFLFANGSELWGKALVIKRLRVEV